MLVAFVCLSDFNGVVAENFDGIFYALSLKPPIDSFGFCFIYVSGAVFIRFFTLTDSISQITYNTRKPRLTIQMSFLIQAVVVEKTPALGKKYFTF